ncbi:ATP-binding protein [Paraburkholderia acidisoli]|uniref:histidine kinase n=1 Tax=Paraburkholderia acidisoli TaxID=2571748 RepID=A0A7Z2GRI0_9BURK|nr:ATP-binding protein [Paraburkholderia acidisoli]QGZ66632.1 hypothetical protein FAZ98_33300 [Paraburkholderia acidisoli]
MNGHAIRHRLSLVVLACVVVVWLAALYGCFRHASREVQEWGDGRLVEYASFIAALDTTDLARFTQTPPSAQFEVSTPNAPAAVQSQWDEDASPRDILFQVLDRSGKSIASSLPAAAAAFTTPVLGAPPRNVEIQGVAWRFYAYRDETSGRIVRVMETANTRSDLVTGTAWQIVWPLLVALPVLAVVLWLAIGRSLVPLRTLSATIRARDAKSLTPLGIAAVPVEVKALVDAIDQLLAQLRQSLVRERAFTADAAHELKTPLAAIKVQAQVALSVDDPAMQRLAMQRVVQGVDRSARLAEQLLLLARLDEHERIPARAVDLRESIDDAIARHAAHAHDKGIALRAHVQSERAIDADPVLIGILLDNLVDNAIKYGVHQGHVEVSLCERGEMQCLAVRDDGPGVAAADLARLTDRFYRASGAQSPGSGLGLSIVERIANYFNGAMTLGPGNDGRGLGVVIEFAALHDGPGGEAGAHAPHRPTRMAHGDTAAT